MTIHFEDFWVEAEEIGRHYNMTVPQHIESIKHHLDLLSEMVKLQEVDSLTGQKQAELIGAVIFELCGITDKLGINSAAALKLISENKKARLLDPGDEEEYYDIRD